MKLNSNTPAQASTPQETQIRLGSTALPKLKPTVGDCYRLNIARQNVVTHHSVLILACEDEWCTILDLEAHGQPNPAAGERVRWTNAHFQFQPLPLAHCPSVARRCRPTANIRSRAHTALALVRQCARPAHTMRQQSSRLNGVVASKRSHLRPDAEVQVTVA